jgi:hypothetical protein
MEIVSTHIDKELNVIAMDFQQLTKDDSLLQCTTLKPQKKSCCGWPYLE